MYSYVTIYVYPHIIILQMYAVCKVMYFLRYEDLLEATEKKEQLEMDAEGRIKGKVGRERPREGTLPF